MSLRVWLGLSCALALGGCDFAPDYQPPGVALPSQFSDASGAQASFRRAANGGALSRPRARSPRRARSTPPIPISRPRLPTTRPPKRAPPPLRRALSRRSTAARGLTANKQSDNRPLRSATQPTYYGDNQLYGDGRLLRARRLGPRGGHRQGGRGQREATGDAFADARLELHASLRATMSICEASTLKPSCSPTRSRSTATRST